MKALSLMKNERKMKALSLMDTKNEGFKFNGYER